MDNNHDSPELEALFDQIKQETTAVAAEPVPPPVQEIFEGDCDELEALFKQNQVTPIVETAPIQNTMDGDNPELEALFETTKRNIDQNIDSMETLVEEILHEPTLEKVEEVYNRADALYADVGKLAREFHTGLHKLGYDRAITQAVSEVMPDTRERLKYIATLTEQAAERVLTILDDIRPAVDDHLAEGEQLGEQWNQLFAGNLTVEEFKMLAQKTQSHFQRSSGVMKTAGQGFTDIMMAQDFQDLTGQVIKKIMTIVEDMEHNLAKILVAHQPQTTMADTGSLENGPVIDTSRPDVVNSQQEVDDLLSSLGF